MTGRISVYQFLNKVRSKDGLPAHKISFAAHNGTFLIRRPDRDMSL